LTKPICVLVVDDDYRVAAVHAAYVAKVEGFEVVGQAHTANEALHAVATLSPDLVLMDVFLPDGDGLSVVRRLMENEAHPDVIVITAARDAATVRKAMQLGAVHYLVKPFGFATLNERLQVYRRLRRRIAQLPVTAEQSDVDELFGTLRAPSVARTTVAKGHSTPTLERVRDAVRTANEPVSAAEVAERIGISRATAQRYLNYLERTGYAHLQPRYGATGRPEHRYEPVERIADPPTN
jgi:response regulator of citrate/malate metabolism